MDRGSWLATVHKVAKSQTWLKWLSMNTSYFSLYAYLPWRCTFYLTRICTDNHKNKMKATVFSNTSLLEGVWNYSIHWFSLFVFLKEEGSKMSVQHCPLFISLLMGHFKHFQNLEECWCHEYVSSQHPCIYPKVLIFPHLLILRRLPASSHLCRKRVCYQPSTYYREFIQEDSGIAFVILRATHTE